MPTGMYVVVVVVVIVASVLVLPCSDVAWDHLQVVRERSCHGLIVQIKRGANIHCLTCSNFSATCDHVRLAKTSSYNFRFTLAQRERVKDGITRESMDNWEAKNLDAAGHFKCIGYSYRKTTVQGPTEVRRRLV